MLSRGTKSLLWGTHCMLWHPLIVAYCYWKIYGFPWNPKLWACFYLHDIGYFGCSTMDGENDGKWHPIRGSYLIGNLFGIQWQLYCLFHSRAMQKQYNEFFSSSEYFKSLLPKTKISKLCIADKLAVKYTPLFCFNKDELKEYMDDCGCTDKKEWKILISKWAEDFVNTNKDSAYDVSDY